MTAQESAVRVSKLGYIGIETPDLDRMVEYYTTVLDLVVVEQSAQGAFLTTGFDHHCVALTPGPGHGRTAIGYEIWEPLDDAESRLRDAAAQRHRPGHP